jgi:hypothetical protein
MSQDEKKSGGNTLTIISLIVTLVAALLGSPVLVEWIKSQQATATPSTPITQTPIVVTPLPDYTDQILIFHEDFDSDNVSGFSYQGNWQIGKDKNNRILETGEPGKATFGPSDFTNGIIEFRVQIQNGAEGNAAAVNFRESGNTAYALVIAENQIFLGLRDGNGSVQVLSDESVRSLVFEPETWYLIRVEVRGPQMIVFVDNNRIMSASDDRLSKGGLSFSVNAPMQTAFDDVSVWELK